MIIGNPLYATIFKYLMEDPEIARRLIGMIIGQEISEIQFAAQEKVFAEPSYPLSLFRMDFIATIETKSGAKKVLIEVQKAKRDTDISRFRVYLGKQYSDRKQLYPLITIYFLGYKLVDLPESVIHVSRQVKGLVSGNLYPEKNEFISLLTHETYLIQVARLHKPLRTPLEKVLSIFDQSETLEEGFLMNYPYEEVPQEAQAMVRRLQGAANDADIRKGLELEAELEYEYRMTLGKKEQELQAEIKRSTLLLKRSVLALHKSGLSTTEIAASLEVTAEQVRRILDANIG